MQVESGQDPDSAFAKVFVKVFVKSFAELIFVTDITDYICGEKSVMWRNFRFL